MPIYILGMSPHYNTIMGQDIFAFPKDMMFSQFIWLQDYAKPWQSSWKSAERCSMDTGKIHRIIHSIEIEVFSNEVWKTWAPSQPYIG